MFDISGIANISEIILIFIALISLIATLIASVISLIKKIFGERLSPAFRYYIWAIFIIRLLFPILPESNMSVYHIAINIYQSISSSQTDIQTTDIFQSDNINAEIIAGNNTQSQKNKNADMSTKESINNENGGAEKTDSTQKNIQTMSGSEKSMTVAQILLFIYLSITILSLSLYTVNYFKYKRKITNTFADAGEEDQRLLNDIRKMLNIKKNIKLYQGSESMLIGILSPSMVLSAGCADSDKTAIITHELLHYKNKDNIINILLIFIKCLYWFNPFIHYFIGKIKSDMELLCDIKSIRTLNYRKDEYAMMLFKASTQNKNKKHDKKGDKAPSTAMCMSASGKQLIYRLKYISSFKKAHKFSSFVALMLVTVLIVTTLTNPIGVMADSDWAEEYAQLLTDEGVYDFTNTNLNGEITAVDYANLIYSAFENMNMPYEQKNKVLSMRNGDGILDIANAMLDDANKIAHDKILIREQAAYITDTVIAYLELYSDYDAVALNGIGEGNLTIIPEFMTAEMFEEEILAKFSEKSDDRTVHKINAYYTKKDLNDPDLTETAREELLTTYSIFTKVLENTAVYIFDPMASERERLEILSYLNEYTTLTDTQVLNSLVKLCMDYSIISTNFIDYQSPLVPLYVMRIGIYLYPDMSEEDQEIYQLILDSYVETTLADESLTQEEYDYALNEYLQQYVFGNYNYYKLKDDVTAEQKREIAEIFENLKEIAALLREYRGNEYGDYNDPFNLKINTPDLPEEYWDIYELFDDEYDIPIIAESMRFNNIFNNIHKFPSEEYFNEQDFQQNEQYREKVFSYYELVDYSSNHTDVNPEDIIIYKLRNDISKEDITRIELYWQFESRNSVTNLGIFKINDEIKYKDANSISAWAQDSVEKMHKAYIMTGEEGSKFNPAGKLTWGETAKIIANILCSIMFYG